VITSLAIIIVSPSQILLYVDAILLLNHKWLLPIYHEKAHFIKAAAWIYNEVVIFLPQLPFQNQKV
jgi:hypothetical protein